jgi:hypothetical protein
MQPTTPQQRVLDSQTPHRLIVGGRRSGKSQLLLQLYRAAHQRHQAALIIQPNAAMTKIFRRKTIELIGLDPQVIDAVVLDRMIQSRRKKLFQGIELILVDEGDLLSASLWDQEILPRLEVDSPRLVITGTINPYREDYHDQDRAFLKLAQEGFWSVRSNLELFRFRSPRVVEELMKQLSPEQMAIQTGAKIPGI